MDGGGCGLSGFPLNRGKLCKGRGIRFNKRKYEGEWGCVVGPANT